MAIAVQIGISFSDYFQPASPNYGAVLSRSVEDANRIVAEIGLPREEWKSQKRINDFDSKTSVRSLT
jgi:hypothetical protein